MAAPPKTKSGAPLSTVFTTVHYSCITPRPTPPIPNSVPPPRPRTLLHESEACLLPLSPLLRSLSDGTDPPGLEHCPEAFSPPLLPLSLSSGQVSGGADLFIGYGGVVARPAVEAEADWFVNDYAELEAAMKCYKVRERAKLISARSPHPNLQGRGRA